MTMFIMEQTYDPLALHMVMCVTELLINGVLRVKHHDEDDCLGFFGLFGAIFTTAGRIDLLSLNQLK